MKLRKLLLIHALLYCVTFITLHGRELPCNQDYTFARHYALKAKTLSKNSQKREALIYYQKALNLNPKNVRIIYAMAQVSKNLNLFERATKLYEQALELDPNNIPLIFDAANMFTMINRLDRALVLYKKILIINPKAIEAQHNYAYALQKKGLIPQAIDIYQEIIALHPDYARAHVSLALAYLSIGDFERGWAEYEWRWHIDKKELKKYSTPLKKEPS